MLQLAEPDYHINLPTTLGCRFKGNFDLTHRFNGNLRRGSFTDQLSTLFGIDEGATVGFEYRIAIARHLEVAAYRTTFAQTIQIYGKYDVIHQHDSTPFSVSPIVSIEGTNNFQGQFAPAVGASVSHDWRLPALYAVPMWVDNPQRRRRNSTYSVSAAACGSVPRCVSRRSSPRLSGFAPGRRLFRHRVRAGAHMSQLNFTTVRAPCSRRSRVADSRQPCNGI
jgi:hypothetical protein